MIANKIRVVLLIISSTILLCLNICPSTVSAARIRNRQQRRNEGDAQGIINLKTTKKNIATAAEAAPGLISDLEGRIADARKLVAESAVAVEKSKRDVRDDQEAMLGVLKEKVYGETILQKLKMGHNKTKKSTAMIKDGVENIEFMKQNMIKYKEALNKLAALQAKNEQLNETGSDLPVKEPTTRVVKSFAPPTALSRRQKLLKNLGLNAYKIALFNTSAENTTSNISISHIMEQKWRQELSLKTVLETKVDKLQKLMNETLTSLRAKDQKKGKKENVVEKTDEENEEEYKESKHDWKSLEGKLKQRIPDQEEKANRLLANA